MAICIHRLTGQLADRSGEHDIGNTVRWIAAHTDTYALHISEGERCWILYLEMLGGDFGGEGGGPQGGGGHFLKHLSNEATVLGVFLFLVGPFTFPLHVLTATPIQHYITLTYVLQKQCIWGRWGLWGMCARPQGFMHQHSDHSAVGKTPHRASMPCSLCPLYMQLVEGLPLIAVQTTAFLQCLLHHARSQHMGETRSQKQREGRLAKQLSCLFCIVLFCMPCLYKRRA